jgi:hypothetical protein
MDQPDRSADVHPICLDGTLAIGVDYRPGAPQTADI